VTLLTVDNPDERRFYEIEAAENSWSVRELERQSDKLKGTPRLLSLNPSDPIHKGEHT